MTKKSIIISVISVICLVGIVSFAMYGCSSKGGNEKKEKTGVSGQITVISREEGSGTRDAFVELMGVKCVSGKFNRCARLGQLNYSVLYAVCLEIFLYFFKRHFSFFFLYVLFL